STFYQAAGGTLIIGTSTSNGVISGTPTLSLIGGGIFSFAGANTYSGGTKLTNGTLVIAVATVGTTSITSSAIGTGLFNLGSGTNSVTLQASTGSGTTRTLKNSISLDGDITFSPGPGQTTGRIALD